MAKRDLTGAVDFSILESFAANDRSVIDEVLSLFQEQVQIWSPMLSPEAEGWRDAAHTVKGAALGLGALALADACRAAEAATDELAPHALQKVLHQLDLALSDVAAYRHEMMLQAIRSGD